jgi:putative membrane protein
LAFLVISLVISNTLENLGVLTGFPFGPYQYTDALGARLFQVPLLVSLAWFAMGYLSWTLAGVLADPPSPKPSWIDLLRLPVIAAFLMMSWDLTFDPLSSTIYRSWTWKEGGPYFGVPVSNFSGWFLTAFLVMLAFAIYLRFGARNSHKDFMALPKWYWLAAVIAYGMMGLFPLTSWLALPQAAVTDPSGRTWMTEDICAALTLVSLCTMVFTALLSCVRIMKGDSHQP